MIGLTAGLVIEGQTGNGILAQVRSQLVQAWAFWHQPLLQRCFIVCFTPFISYVALHSWLDIGHPLSVFSSDRHLTVYCQQWSLEKMQNIRESLVTTRLILFFCITWSIVKLHQPSTKNVSPKTFLISTAIFTKFAFLFNSFVDFSSV